MEKIKLGGIEYRVREIGQESVRFTLPYGKILYVLPRRAYDTYKVQGFTNMLPITKGYVWAGLYK